MADHNWTEQDISDLLGAIGKSAGPDPDFQAALQQRLDAQLNQHFPNGQRLHTGSSAGWHGIFRDFRQVATQPEENHSMKNRKPILIPALAVSLTGLLLLGLVAILLLRQGQEISVGTGSGAATATLIGDQGDTGMLVGPLTPTPIPPPDPGYAEDDQGLKVGEIFYALPGDIFYAYNAITVEQDGQQITEMRFNGNDYFIILDERPDDGSPLPQGEPVDVSGHAGVLADTLSGTAHITGDRLQDGGSRLVLSRTAGDDGEIGGDRDYPAELTYNEYGYQVVWVMDGYRYTASSNLPQDFFVPYLQMLPQIADGTLPGSPDGFVPDNNAPHLQMALIGEILAQDTYYAAAMTVTKRDDLEVTEFRFYGDERFFILTFYPASREAVEKNDLGVQGYPGTLESGLSGVALMTGPTLHDGTGEPVSGGGGGGGSALTDYTYPDQIAYQDAYRLIWIVDGVEYVALTNTTESDIIRFGQHATDVMTGKYRDEYTGSGDPSAPEAAASSARFSYTDPESGFGFSLGMGELAFEPLNFGYLPPTFLVDAGALKAEAGKDGRSAEVTLYNLPLDALLIMTQSLPDENVSFPAAPTVEVNGYPAALIANPECSTPVDIPSYLLTPTPAMTPATPGMPSPLLGPDFGGGTVTITVTCAKDNSWRLVWFPPGLRVEITVSNLPQEVLFQIAKALQ